MSHPLLVVIAGPAGSGKSTLCDRLVEEGGGFHRVVTSTTRAPRAGEIDGVHYHFLTPAAFDQMVAKGLFLEWAWVHGERRYGTLAESVLAPLRQGRDLVISVDVQGVESMRQAAQASRDRSAGQARGPVLDEADRTLFSRALTTVFIRVDHERLLARMRSRGKDDEAEINRRMATAEAELREAPRFDHVIESRTRDEDFDALLRIVKQARNRAQADH